MRLINSSRKFSIGSRIKMTKDFKNGMFLFKVGSIGKIVGDHLETLPDFGLFNAFLFGFAIAVGASTIKARVNAPGYSRKLVRAARS